MKLLDWLFSINRDNAPLVSEKVKTATMGYKCVARITPVAHGIGGLRLDWAIAELTPDNCNSMHSYWRNKHFKFRGGSAGTIQSSSSYRDGFRSIELSELIKLKDMYTNQRICSLYEGKPTL